MAADGSEYCSPKCKDAVAAEAKAEADRAARDARRDAVSEETGRYLAPNADVGRANIGGGLAKNRQETPEEREKRLEADRLGRAKRDSDREEARRAERLKNRPKGQAGGNQDKGGNGTSRKARQAAKKRHQGSDYYHGSSKGIAVKKK